MTAYPGPAQTAPPPARMSAGRIVALIFGVNLLLGAVLGAVGMFNLQRLAVFRHPVDGVVRGLAHPCLDVVGPARGEQPFGDRVTDAGADAGDQCGAGHVSPASSRPAGVRA